MAKNTSVILGDHFLGLADELVASGRYGSTTEVVRAGLRLLEEREAKMDALRKAIQEGIDSGPPEPFDLDSFLTRKHRERQDRDIG